MSRVPRNVPPRRAKAVARALPEQFSASIFTAGLALVVIALLVGSLA